MSEAPVTKKHKRSTDGGGQPPAPRRALSCTECKRRKTRCSSLGRIPCDACVKRGKPEDCRWEGLEGIEEPQISPVAHQRSSSTSLTSSDVAALRDQVEKLQHIVEALTRHQTLQTPSSTSTSHRPLLPSTSTSTSASSNSLPTAPHSVRSIQQQLALASSLIPDNAQAQGNLESAATSLEQLVLGPGLRPGITETPALAVTSPPAASARSSKLFPLLSKSASTREEDHIWDETAGLLPGSQVVPVLVHDYFNGPLNKGWHIVPRIPFSRQVDIYSTMSPALQKASIDPGWLAVYFMILAFSIKFADVDRLASLMPSRSREDITALPGVLYHASVNALEESNYLAAPQIRHIQASLLYVNFLFHFGDSAASANVALRHLDSAISTAQWLGLDIMADDPCRAPLNDRAFEDLSPRAALEAAKVLFFMLSMLDGTIYKRPGLWRLGTALENATAMPRNLNDDDHQYSTDPVGRRSTEFTESSLSIVGGAFGNTIRKFARAQKYALASNGADDMPYGEVLEYDNALRDDLGLMPSEENRNSEAGWMLNHVYSSIHNRILRMHRPYMVRGYCEERWMLSKQASIESARAIIASQLLVRSWLRPGFVKRWILGAAIILAVDYVISTPPSPTPDHPFPCISRAGVVSAREIFEDDARRMGQNTSLLTRQCLKAIEALIAAGDVAVQRQRDAAAHHGDGRGVGLGVGGKEGVGDANALLARYFEEVKMKFSVPDEIVQERMYNSNNSTENSDVLPPAPQPTASAFPLLDFFDFSFLSQPINTQPDTQVSNQIPNGEAGPSSGGLNGPSAVQNGGDIGYGMGGGLDVGGIGGVPSGVGTGQADPAGLGFWAEFGWNEV
ncbi:hypothetical protein IAT38_003013 [Cryptococcus sp. DSM 104549]